MFFQMFSLVCDVLHFPTIKPVHLFCDEHGVPSVTIFCWTLPTSLQHFSGWCVVSRLFTSEVWWDCRHWYWPTMESRLQQKQGFQLLLVHKPSLLQEKLKLCSVDWCRHSAMFPALFSSTVGQEVRGFLISCCCSSLLFNHVVYRMLLKMSQFPSSPQLCLQTSRFVRPTVPNPKMFGLLIQNREKQHIWHTAEPVTRIIASAFQILH